MQRRAVRMALAAATGLALLAAGCSGTQAGSGSFDRTLSVSGPVRLEVQNGSGSVQISPGEAGQVRVRGEIRVRALPWQDVRRRLEEITSHPPVEQQGNLVRVGYATELLRAVTVNYTIIVPADATVQTEVGSGSVEVRGIRGPAKLTTGSGSLRAENIREDVQAASGSGSIQLAGIEGQVRATAGSGDLTLRQVRGEIRAATGSGDITIDQPGSRISAKTGSGDVTVKGAGADLRAATGSGDVTIQGNPTPTSYWELRTGSGSVEIGVPPDASFQLYAYSSSGAIDTGLPMVVEERTKRELRARVGSGAARIEVKTGSGGIRIR